MCFHPILLVDFAPARRGRYFSLRKVHTPRCTGEFRRLRAAGCVRLRGAGGISLYAKRTRPRCMGELRRLRAAGCVRLRGAGSISLYRKRTRPRCMEVLRPLRRAGCAAPARRGRARGGGTPCSPSSCQSPPLPSGRAARVMAGNTKQLPPVCRTGQSLPFRTPRGERVQRSKKFSSPKPLRESASRNAPVFSQRSRSAELCGSKACAVQSKKGVIHKRGNFLLLCACRACGIVPAPPQRATLPCRPQRGHPAKKHPLRDKKRGSPYAGNLSIHSFRPRISSADSSSSLQIWISISTSILR